MRHIHLVSTALALCALTDVAGRAASASAESSSSLPQLPEGKTWQLVWDDEFNGDTIDSSKWEDIGEMPRRDGFWVKEDAYLDGKGHLVLRTKQDGERYTSGAIRTRGKYEPKFGYLEVRCKMPKEEGGSAGSFRR